MQDRLNKRPKARTSNFTRGGQIIFHNIRMYFQVIGAIFHWYFLAIAIIAGLAIYSFIDAETLKATQYHWKVWSISKIHPDTREVTLTWQGEPFTETIGILKESKLLNDANDKFMWILQIGFLFGFIVVTIITTIIMKFFNKKGAEQTEDCLVRGVRVVEPSLLSKELIRDKNASDFKIDGLQLLTQDFEVRHLLFSGTTGAGKSVAIRKLLQWIRARGDKAIVYDKGCTFVSRFYDESQDTILNPFDERSAYWDLWCDANRATDFENHAMALIPEHGDGDPFWVQSARTIFASTAYKMQSDGKPCTTERLLELILTSQLETLTEYLDGTESASLVSDKIQKTAISIKSVLAAYIKSLRFLEGLDKPDSEGNPRKRFSIRDWVLDDDEKGFLFLTSNAEQHASLRPLISMWLSIASTSILGLSENPNRRIWVIMDEAPSIHKLPELPNVLAEVRKHGGCFLLGIQSYAQLVKTYGQHAADEMYDLLNSRFYYRNPSAPMAKKSSEDLGEQELEVSKEQYSYGANSVRDGISLGHQTITRPTVSASEIMLLDDLSCWLRVAGNYPVTRLDLKFDQLPQVAKGFVFRDYESSEAMKKVDALLAHYQLGALSSLPTEDRNRLLAIHKSQFEGDEKSQQAEEKRMQSSVEKTNQQDEYDVEKQKQIEAQELRAQLATPDAESSLHDMHDQQISDDNMPSM
ncbi:type IV conjugative transfer system coupling protein TraD [Shewanella sairae]|uniref:type IV conjugative transfer system coupling protein TraD n=6 Tax=Shewanella sairae TaxID=190310 RepID=UPI00200FF3F5|nr:type IV conjugative transfer system coupling protein TraD [Shewanella sairae]MCL1132093.1 type IV conjugative transfer system coupling protein TraD [Shewanella sairae]